MSGTKQTAARAASIRLTDDEKQAAQRAAPPLPRTAPGQLLEIQSLKATVARKDEELALMRQQLTTGSDIALDLIDEVEGRRRKLTSEEYAELTENLRRHPLGQPITLRPKADGRYELVAGHNRTAIYRDLGRTTIPAFIAEVADDQVEMVAFLSNLLSPALSDFEKYWNFKKLALISGLTHAAIADSTGLSRAHVSRIMKFDALPEEAKLLLKDAPDRLGSNAAEKLAQLAQAGRADEVTAAIQKLVTDETVTQDQAIALAKPASTAPAPLEKHTVKHGKQTFCDITVRNNVVGIRFGKAVSEDDAKRWAAKFKEFVEAEKAKEQ
ncbi:ParB/RepB/Spo0J family partition protein [Cupriavidus sp. TMH.W2]|uniref:ParB/RepB/Spo0J family partition protein n=1 Tax=Cupriavidus sp. TMH.W2 TaxID=3434465 RepID=UPI003D76D92C